MLTVTQTAHAQINEILLGEPETKYVRAFIEGGGCAGFNYDWSFTDEEQREDIVIDDMLVVDRINELYLTGMELDYTYDDFESAFVFNNPKATSSCGCGTSFSV